MLLAHFHPLICMTLQPAPNDADRQRAYAVMSRIGAGLLRQSKASQENSESSTRKDIPSLLVQANIMQDLPQAQRMTDEDVLARACRLILD